MSFMFYNCFKLCTLPDTSKWRTENVNDMRAMFYACHSLLSLPNISEWNTNQVYNMSYLFFDVVIYQNYQIFLNGIQIMLLI